MNFLPPFEDWKMINSTHINTTHIIPLFIILWVVKFATRIWIE